MSTRPLPTLYRTVDPRRTALRLARTGALLAVAAIAIGAVPQPAAAADESLLDRLAMCKDSWFDWKDSRPRTTQFVADLKSRMKSDDGGQSYRPVGGMTFFGAPVLIAYPQSIGMGVGFSMLLKTDLASARKIVERELGRPLKCERSDGMESCGVEIADKKTATVMANAPGGQETLVGCYYFYQQ